MTRYAPVPPTLFRRLIFAVGMRAYPDKVAALYGPIEDWDVSQVTDMSDAFAFPVAAALTGPVHTRVDLSRWDTSRVTTMARMFSRAADFDADLGGWDVSRVTDMTEMFRGTEAFRGRGLERWNVGRVTVFSGMFAAATRFDADLGNWDVSRATRMTGMFMNTEAFRGRGLERWDVSRVTTMAGMFCDAEGLATDGLLDDWDVGRVAYMNRMFFGVRAWGYGQLLRVVRPDADCTEMADEEDEDEEDEEEDEEAPPPTYVRPARALPVSGLLG